MWQFDDSIEKVDVAYNDKDAGVEGLRATLLGCVWSCCRCTTFLFSLLYSLFVLFRFSTWIKVQIMAALCLLPLTSR